MNRKEYQAELFRLFETEVEDLSFEERMALIEKCCLEYQKKHDKERVRPKHGKPWSDQEIALVLQGAPTMENCLKYAKILGRGYGGVELVYRWASATDERVRQERPNDAFVAHVKRIAKETGWRA